MQSSNQNQMNFPAFIASLTPEQEDALKNFLHDKWATYQIKQTRASNSYEEAYWNGRLETIHLLYCYIDPKHFGNEETTKEFIELSNNTPDEWLNENSDDYEEDEEDEDDDDEDDKDIHPLCYATIGDSRQTCVVKRQRGEKDSRESYVLFVEDGEVHGGDWVNSSSIEYIHK